MKYLSRNNKTKGRIPWEKQQIIDLRWSPLGVPLQGLMWASSANVLAATYYQEPAPSCPDQEGLIEEGDGISAALSDLQSVRAYRYC